MSNVNPKFESEIIRKLKHLKKTYEKEGEIRCVLQEAIEKIEKLEGFDGVIYAGRKYVIITKKRFDDFQKSD